MGLSDLTNLDAESRTLRPNAKPPKRKTLKGRKDRAEAKVKKTVRAQCVERDGYCRGGSAKLAHWSNAMLVAK